MVVFLLLLCFCPILVSAQSTVPEWRAHTPMTQALSGHRAVLLPTGDVLVAGGVAQNGQTSTTSLLYSASDGSFRPTLNSLNEARAWYAMVAVPMAGGGGRVFAIGGYTSIGADYRSTASVEVAEFDPVQSNWRWRVIGNLSVARGDLGAAWDGGDFIIVGGGRSQLSGAAHSGTRTSVTDRINVRTLTIQAISDMATPRSEQTLVRVTDALGKTLMVTAGGESTVPTTATELLTATTWDPRANPPLVYRSWGVGVGDPSGIGRTFGGFNEAGVPLNTCEWYDVKSGWRFAPRMESERARAHATLVAGTVDTAKSYLIVGGQGLAGELQKTEVFALPDGSNPNGLWTPFSELGAAGAERTVTITGKNLALVTGGERASGRIAGTEIFQPLRADNLQFGSEETGRLSDSLPLRITNEWLLPVKVERIRLVGSAEFVFYGDTSDLTVGPGAGRTIFVRFRPAAPGVRTGMLLMDVGSITDTVMLRGTGIESSLSVVTTSISFDSVLVKSSRQLCFPAIRNIGTDPATIDSVVLAPPGDYQLISPIGRVTIQPGDTLQVCVKFAPRSRGVALAALAVNLAGRNFPIAVDGIGIRRFATVLAISECDTVTAIPGTSQSTFMTLRNPGDRPVTITQAVFNASVAGLFALADPTILPLTLLPGQSFPVEILFTPQREATERGTVTFTNDGDTATVADLCFVVRSRYLSSSVPVIDFGTICSGDSVTRTVILDNPGGFDTVDLATVTVNDSTASVTVDNVPATQLAPHQYVSVTAHFVPQTVGTFNGEIIAAGSFGSVSIPVTGVVLPGLRFEPQPMVTSPATTVIIPVNLVGGAGVPVANIQLNFTYNRTLLYPTGVVSLAGGPNVNPTSTLVQARPGEAVVNVVWSAPLLTDGAAFGVECEVLRGDDEVTPVGVSGTGGSDFCVASAVAQVLVTGPCGGTSGLLRTGGASLLRMTPTQAGKLQLDVVSPREGELYIQVFNMLGAMLLQRDAGFHNGGTTTMELPLDGVPSGAYIVRAVIGYEHVDQQPVVIGR